MTRPDTCIAEGRTWEIATTSQRHVALVLDPSSSGDEMYLSVYIDGDGPSANLTPVQARAAGLALIERAALLDADAATQAHTEQAARAHAQLEADRCSSCPWPPGTHCGGAYGVCEGNARPEVHLG